MRLTRSVVVLTLILLGLATRFAFVWYPNEVVFDEVHFGKFVSAYFDGKYYFDIHPPLGKLLIAGFVKFFGFRSGFDFDRIGEGYGDIPYVALRFLPNLAGALIPLAVFLWLDAMGVSRPASFLAGLLLVFDNAMLAQSHFVLVDSFLILFGFAGLWLFLRARALHYRLRDTALAGAALGLSFSVKWTGLAFFGLALAVMLVDWVAGVARRRARGKMRRGLYAESRQARNRPLSLAIFLCAAIAVYVLVFWIHFALLKAPGPGDAYMSAEFFGKSFLGKFFELNAAMFRYNQTLTAGHPYGSPAWTWPLMVRPVYYWVRDFAGGTTGRIYALGNPAVWWGSTLGFIAALFLWRPKRREKKWILYAGYLIHMIPFFFITRVIFLYHYLPALGFAVAILAGWLFDDGAERRGKQLLWMLIAAGAMAGFLFFAPLSYGLPLSESQYTMRVWLSSWR